ncbi:uncharacterized protein OCT59_018406 [Rhizophagus irregularis]|uniref:uncharacterized protein n=1 Tax=Rhizophagus irregularis TaxID=588596 RepID=UPI00331876B9|nr:hypothetical protein OCT59_018406 [Rhizophagus irregularis]
MNCAGYTDKSVCNECLSLKVDKNLQNRIAIVKPPKSKLKHIPKHYFENDPLKKYLKYVDLNIVWSLIKDNNSDTASDVWVTLANKEGLTIQNIRRLRSNSEDILTDPTLCFENENNSIAKYVRVYILQVPLPKFPPVIIALLPNNRSDKTESIVNIHKLLLDFAQELGLHIISIGSDGATGQNQCYRVYIGHPYIGD